MYSANKHKKLLFINLSVFFFLISIITSGIDEDTKCTRWKTGLFLPMIKKVD